MKRPDDANYSTKGTAARVAVIGGGYVGLPTAAVLASFGHRVTLAENNSEKLRLLRDGKSPYFEVGLEPLMNEVVSDGRLRFVFEASAAVQGVEVAFICVPTPQSDDGSTDVSYIRIAISSIAKELEPNAIVVIKSTVPVGTASWVYDLIGRSDISIVSNPEFLSAGNAVAESFHPERIVIGAFDQESAERVATLFAQTQSPIVITSNATAETIKYAANAFLAVRLSFSNELSRFCEKVEANILDLIQGLGFDHRIGFSYLQPGPGWGGSCLPKDTASLLMMGKDHDFDFPVLSSAVATNKAQLEHVVQTILSKLPEESDRVVGIWGLTFKAGTDDRRNSPALNVARRLIELGIKVKAYDPTVESGDSDDLNGIDVRLDAYDAANQTSLVVLLTEWPEFQSLDWERVSDLIGETELFDTRNVLRDSVSGTTLKYSSIGTPNRG